MDSSRVQFIRVEDLQQGQRLDNFLFKLLKGVPRSRIYRFIRRGEVRINKKRCKPEYKLQRGDLVRIPPHQAADLSVPPAPSQNLSQLLQDCVLLEDDALLLINKPPGLAVHGGSGIRLGLIEAVRQIKPQWQQAELAHRLDRDTSGCLVLCKNMSYLKGLQEQLKNKSVDKRYRALVFGQWPESRVEVTAPLSRDILQSGERIVRVDSKGKASLTRFEVLRRFADCTLLEARPETGRTHQIRVHCQHSGHSIVGDSKYHNATGGKFGALGDYKHLCLHAASIAFTSPLSGKPVSATAPLPDHLQNLIEALS